LAAKKAVTSCAHSNIDLVSALGWTVQAATADSIHSRGAAGGPVHPQFGRDLAGDDHRRTEPTLHALWLATYAFAVANLLARAAAA